MGNHELLLIGAKRFGDTPVNSGAGTATFQAAWLLNGGQKQDMDRLQDVHLQWMSRLDAVVREDDHLLVHSDTTAYLEYGETIEDVNDTVHEILNRNDADEVWDVFRKFTKRFAFRDDGGRRPSRSCSPPTAAAGSCTATARSRTSSARSARRTARTAEARSSTDRTCTPTGSRSPWTAE